MNINNNNDDVNDDVFEDEDDEVVDKSWRSNKTVRKIIKFTAAGVLAIAGGIGVKAAYNLPEAREVSEVTKEVLALKDEVINEVIPAAKGAKADPQALKIMLDRNRMELQSIILKLEKLQREGFRLRTDIISDVVEIVVLGRSYTYNKGLESAHKCGKSFWCSLFFEVEKYESLRGTLKDLNQDLNKLRMILLQLEDIDQVKLTNNFDVNTYLSLGLGESSEFIGDRNDGTMEKEIKRAIKDRKEKIAEMDALDCFDDEFSIGKKKVKVKLSGECDEDALKKAQKVLFNAGLLQSEKQITGKLDEPTKQAVERFNSVILYTVKMQDGAYNPDIVALDDPMVRSLQKIMVYLGYLDKSDIDGKYHEQMNCRVRKMIEDIEKDDNDD